MLNTTHITTPAALTAAMLTLALSGSALAQSTPGGTPQGGPPRGDAQPPQTQPAPAEPAPPADPAPAAPQEPAPPTAEQPPVTTAPPAGEPECTIRGTNRADRLRGTPGDDVICGLGGSDRIKGLGGDDIIRGGTGKDRLHGGAGDDLLDGGAGRDRLNGGAGLDRALTGSRDRLTAVENRERAGTLAQASTGYYDLGPAKCLDFGGSTYLFQTGPAATADTAQWMEHWNAVSHWTGSGWAVDASTWVGPFYSHTDYPGWFWHQQTGWAHTSQGGGESETKLAQGGAYAPVQWMYFYGEQATVFQFTAVSQESYGIPMNQGTGYCTA